MNSGKNYPDSKSREKIQGRINKNIRRLIAVNFLTGSRILLSAGLLACILLGTPGGALALLVVIYGTDIIDGMLARRWCVATRAGAHFDLVADIWFVVLSLSALVITGQMPFWFLLAAAFKFAEFAATSYFLSGNTPRRSPDAGPEVLAEPRSPVFDTMGRFSGILFMASPVPATVLYLILPFPAASILLTGLLACTCGVSVISSCWRLHLCICAKEKNQSQKRAPGDLLESR